MTLKTQVGILLGVAALSFAMGRFTVPVKTEIKSTSTKTVDKNDNKIKKKHKVTTIITAKDGEKKETITEDDNEGDTDTTKVLADKTTDKTVTKQGPGTSLSLLAARNPITGAPEYGASVVKDVLGPITMGIFGLTDGTAGVSLGLRF